MSKSKRTAAVLSLIAFTLCIFLSGCQSTDGGVESFEQLNDGKYTITLDAGSAAAISAKEKFPNANFTYSTSASDAYLAVSSGKADAFVYGKLYMQYAIASESLDDLAILDGVVDTADIAAGVNPKKKALVKPINEFIKQIKADGTLDDMYKRWVVNADTKMPDIAKANNPKTKIRFGTSGMLVPMNYIANDKQLTGFDVEFMKRLALYLNADFTIETMSYDALISSLQTDRLDVAVSDLNITDERKEVILFSDSYMTSETAVIMKSDRIASSGKIDSLDDIDGKNVGYAEGSAYLDKIKSRFPNSQTYPYMSYAELIQALQNGRIDAYITDEPMAKFQMKETTGIKTIDEMITTDRYGFILNKNNTELCDEINKVLAEFRDNGTLDRLKKKWVEGEGDEKIELDDTADTSRGTLRVSTCLDSIPFAYLADNEIVGYDIELIRLIAQRLGYKVEITEYQFEMIINAIVSEKEDIAVGCITYTPERAESVLFTDSTYDSGTVAMIADSSVKQAGFFENLAGSFERTIIRENRWKLIVDGLLVTIELSLLSMIFGTLLGFAFSFPLRSKNKLISRTASIISTILDGLPLLIILMVLYYIIFAKTNLSAITIGVIGLSLDFANSVAGTLNTGVKAVDKGEIEAAVSMGYKKRQIFTKIIFPQAANHMFPHYAGSVISLVKGTSIIGYITVEDLTKAGDIIRARTFEAFFPLVLTAVIYFIIARILVAVLSVFAKKLNPKRRKRTVKGVDTHE